MTSAMQIATIPGETYAVTVTSPCTVCAVMPKSSPLLLITIEDPGQYLVVAPTTALYIDDDSALVTRSFKSAPVGMFSRKVPSGGAHRPGIHRTFPGSGRPQGQPQLLRLRVRRGRSGHSPLHRH